MELVEGGGEGEGKGSGHRAAGDSQGKAGGTGIKRKAAVPVPPVPEVGAGCRRVSLFAGRPLSLFGRNIVSGIMVRHLTCLGFSLGFNSDPCICCASSDAYWAARVSYTATQRPSPACDVIRKGVLLSGSDFVWVSSSFPILVEPVEPAKIFGPPPGNP